MKDDMKQSRANDISQHSVPHWYFVFFMAALSLLLVLITPTAVADKTAATKNTEQNAVQQTSDLFMKAAYANDVSEAFVDSENGRPLNLDAYQNKVVVVEFWGSWCYQCAHSMSWLTGMKKKYQSQGLVVLGVNLDVEKKKALSFQEKYPASFKTIYDPQWQHADYYHVKNVPALLIFDRKGNKVHQHTGFKKEDLPAYEALLGAIISDS